MDHRLQVAHPESVLLALQALGAPISTLDDVDDALKHKRDSDSRRILEPVIVAWDGKVPGLSLPSDARAKLILEDGSPCSWPLQDPLPNGYHRLQLHSARQEFESLIISAPTRANFPLSSKAFGVFAPLYGLHSRRSRGAGDLTDLETLMKWTCSRGGQVVSTLPLLAAYLNEPFEPSPYSPVSRLFWNEFYIDMDRVSEFHGYPMTRHVSQLSRSGLIDYKGTMALKRSVLEKLSREFFKSAPITRRKSFDDFVRKNPHAKEYARFRARTDKAGCGWHSWTDKHQSWEQSDEQYHLYVQWIIQDQLGELAQKSSEMHCLLYLDLPLGLHYDSFDSWKFPHLFVRGITGGAPPDPVFTTGQNWAFQPAHPQAMRVDGYRYVIAYLRNHLKYAKLLRVDHVMGLHRLFWIPDGFDGDRGLYVEYPAEEMYAILSLESHRAGAGVVGENLGVVPSEVNRAMRRHNIRQLYVAQYETALGTGTALRNPPSGSVASLNTHDLFPFQAFLDGEDIDDRLKLRFLSPQEAAEERRERRQVRKALVKSFGRDVFSGCWRFLARSRAGIVLLNLEDLWGETKPQNIPATTRQRPNWRRRLRYSMERLEHLKTRLSP